MVKERIAWIDFLKLLAIYFVVWGHTVLFMGLDHDEVMKNNEVYSFLYSFHMPLFMTISGFFSSKLLVCQGNIKRKFLQLIVPCISLGIICLLCDIHTLNFWYLKSLFICYVIWYLFFFLFHKRLYLGLLLLVVLGFLFFPLLTRIPYLGSYKVDFMLPYFGFGLLIARFKGAIDKRLLPITLVSVVLFLIGEYYWNSNYLWYFSKPFWIDYKTLFLNHTFVFEWDSLWRSLWRYLVGVFGTCFFLFLCRCVNDCKYLGGVISSFAKYGRFSLHVYILQSFIVELNPFGINFPTSNIDIYNYVYTPLFSLFVVIICVFIAQLLEKNKYIAFALFGRQIKVK